LAKISTELYIYVPRLSAKGTAFYTNIWANLTRKDTGEGIGGKWLYAYLDGVELSHLLTVPGSGYAPDAFDINPKGIGAHKAWVEFRGDEDFEPCKSEEITLVCNPNLTNLDHKMQVIPTSGDVPLIIQVKGYIRKYIGASVGYALPLNLMVFEYISTRTMQLVNTVMSSSEDGSYVIDYAFTKPGTYRIFVNFLGDNTYASAWSNNGRTTTITVKEGEFPLSWEETITITLTGTKKILRIISTAEPTTPEGYTRAPEYDLDWGTMGTAWAFVKST